MKIKIDPAKVLSVTVSVLSMGVMLLSNVVDKNNRETMKSELKDEIIKEIAKTTKES